MCNLSTLERQRIYYLNYLKNNITKDLKRYALEYDTNVSAVVLRACREFLAKDKMFKEKYRLHIAQP
jgi:hypothetical protein